MKPNKTRWIEKWLVGGGVQTVKIKIVEDANYDETTQMVVMPCGKSQASDSDGIKLEIFDISKFQKFHNKYI